jgi:ATP citrate (pro-S)-lyase
LQKLVVKPDQLIKRRGKLGLIKVKVDLAEVKQWVIERMGKDQVIGKATGKLRRFIIEPFLAHTQEEEAYVCIYSVRDMDIILFHHAGGVDIGDVDSKAARLDVPVADRMEVDTATVKKCLLGKLEHNKDMVAEFVSALYKQYVALHFTYLEVNPLVVTQGKVWIMDLAAKLDATADFVCRSKWGEVDYPPPFGRDAFPEEAHIAELDAKTGASLKLTILNAAGRIWTMVAGGGASVIYSDTICALGGSTELANYGEYSGAPSEQQTYDYARTIFSLMTRQKHPDGKVLIIGGGIANFTNVAATFKGIKQALEEFQSPIRDHNIRIYVRRAGPNYQEGLRVMREVGQSLAIPLFVFGPETHMTAIVGMALGSREVPAERPSASSTASFMLPGSGQADPAPGGAAKDRTLTPPPATKGEVSSLFTKSSRAIIWGLQTRAVQGMMDFDYVCGRTEPSVAAMVYPMAPGDSKQNFYWGHKEVLVPVYKSMADAMAAFPEVDVMVSFASLRSAYDSTIECMGFSQIRTIAIIAEGIPENFTRKLIKLADKKNVTIIGPATVGGVKPGCFKIGNTGGMMDNILHSKLYRPGSVAYVSRSGGMSNELNNIISQTTNGVYEGIAIGGDRYPCSTFMDHLLRYQADPEVGMLVLLGEVGGTEEYQVCKAIESGVLSKPVVAWCIGTCADMFTTDVQFGHAGASAGAQEETASAKNLALKAAGAEVPTSFDELGEAISRVYAKLVKTGVIVPKAEVPPPPVPMDYNWLVVHTGQQHC